MDYLTNYYKNRCQDLQEQVNLLETLIYEAQIRSSQETERIRGKKAGQKREKLLQGLLDVLNPKLDPIRADKVTQEERDAIFRVIGDSMRSRAAKPGDPTRAKNTAAERELIRMQEFGGANFLPTEGLADVKDMRAALEALQRHKKIGKDIGGKVGEKVMKRKGAIELGPVFKRDSSPTDRVDNT